MGVTKMFTYIKTHCEDCVEYVDLVQVAADRPDGIKILIDFYSWEHFIQSRFISSIHHQTDNPYIILCGGEYKLIRDYMTSFVEALRAVKIELVFFMDGAKGSSDAGADRKWNTWLQRQTRDSNTIRKTIRVLSGELPLKHFNVNTHTITRPCLQEVQNIITLQKLGCNVQTVLSGEADTFLAKYMLEDENTVAVFSNDTDFCIFPSSVYLADSNFDIHNDLEMGQSSLKTKTPSKLICGLIKSDQLWRHFEFPNATSLYELAIIAGNDFTLPVLNEIDDLGSYIGQISKAAEIVREFGTVENIPRFLHSMMSCSALQRAVQHSRAFYSLTLPEDKDLNKDDVTFAIVSDNIRQIKYPSTLFAMYKRFYWHRSILEDTGQSENTAERSMVYLRSYVYSFLLPPDQDTVMEYGKTPYNDFEEMVACKIKQTRLPSLATIQKNSFTKNRALFHLIMSHQEYSIPDFNNSYFRLYGNKLGYICYLLRYFLLLNWQQNLHITPGEFLLACAWLLGHHDPEHYMCVHINPSPRCITLENWVLCLYRTSYAFLGSILNLTHEFPVPADLFSGVVWVNLYTASELSPQTYRHPHVSPRLPREHIRNVNASVKSVLNDKKHVIDNIVKGLFPVKI